MRRGDCSHRHRAPAGLTGESHSVSFPAAIPTMESVNDTDGHARSRATHQVWARSSIWSSYLAAMMSTPSMRVQEKVCEAFYLRGTLRVGKRERGSYRLSATGLLCLLKHNAQRKPSRHL